MVAEGQLSQPYGNYIISMQACFKYFLFTLLSVLCVPLAVTHNYNFSKVHEQALISESLFLPTRPILNAHHKVHIPTLIESAQLKKYQLRDTNYRAQHHVLTAEDQLLLFSMDPPRGLFSQESVFIDNYCLLQNRKFSIEVANPSSRFKLCVVAISADRSELKRDDERGTLPVCLQPSESHSFAFTLYVPWLNPQYVQSAVYFFVEVFDGKVLAEEKVYARKVLVSVKPNHLRLETPIFRSCPRHHVVVLKNYEVFEVGLVVEGKRKFQTMEGMVLEGEVRVQPTKSIRVLLEGKPTQLIIHTITAPGQPVFPSLLLETICEEPVTLDYFNIGLLPEQRAVFQYPLTLTSTRSDNATVEEIILSSTSETVVLQAMPGFTGVVPPMSKHMQIGLVRVFARKQPEKRSIITIKMKVSTALDQFWTTQKYIYQQLRNPISAGARRFVDLRKADNSHERFSLKNNLNVPLFLTRFHCNEEVLQLTWIGERRKLVPPNQAIEELSFQYVGPRQIRLSPEKHILILEFNGNLLVPIEVVVFDQSLQCLVDNQAHRCANVTALDFGYFRDRRVKTKQIIIRNWNPQGMPLSLEVPTAQGKEQGISLTLEIFGPLPGEGQREENYSGFFLKPNHFLVVNIAVEPLPNATSTALPLQITTSQESIELLLVIRVQNGTIALIPQVVRFQNPMQRTIEYLNLVSTYSQKYRIANVSTNLSSVVVAIPPHGDLFGNQFVGMTVVYDPYPAPRNASEHEWSSSRKQTEYFLHRIKKEYETILYAQVKLTTSTELQARSTIIIERNYPPLLQHTQLRDSHSGIRCAQWIVTKRKPKPSRYGEVRHGYDVSLQLRNGFPFPLRYRPFLASELKFMHLEQYFKHFRLSKQQKNEEIFLCMSEQLKGRSRMGLGQIKDIFQLHQLPEQYILEVGLRADGSSQIFLRNAKGANNNSITVNPNSRTYHYLVKAHRDDNRICYYFIQHQLINRLILDDLLLQILEQEGQRTFKEFVRSELHNLEHMAFFQNETEHPPVRTKQSYMRYCWEHQQYSVYRFCDTLHARVLTPKPDPSLDHSLLQPHQTHKITLQLVNPADSLKFYLILANNATQFQTYQLQLQIKPPSLYIRSGYISPQFIQIYNQIWSKWQGSNLLPVQLFTQDYHSQDTLFQGTRSFELVNDGDSDIFIDHIGIDDKHHACTLKGITLNGLTCGSNQDDSTPHYEPRPQNKPFLIKAMSKYNLTVKFLLNLRFWPTGKRFPSLQSKESLKYTIYLYDDKGYHFKLHLILRIGDHDLAASISHLVNPNRGHALYGYLAINAASLLIVSLLLMKLKDQQHNLLSHAREQREKAEEDPFKSMLRFRRLGRILKEQTYFDTDLVVGVKLNKKAVDRPIHRVTEDLLLSAKEVTQRQLKKYFNESEESAIGVILELNHHLSLSQSMSDHQIPEETQAEGDIVGEEVSEEEGSSSDLPEGEEVDLTEEVEEDSWYDFNRESHNESNKSNRAINTTVYAEPEEEEFYNVFRSDVGLRKIIPDKVNRYKLD